MLSKFKSKEQKPHPPKNQIEVVCPVCGAAQYEPRLVVTTLCRKCGEHLRISGRKILASSQINPVPSSVYPAEFSSTGRVFEQPEPQFPNAPASSEPQPNGAPKTSLRDIVNPPPPPKSQPHFPPPPAPLPERPAAADATASTLQRMKEQGYYRQQYFKDVECFGCSHKFKVGRSAKSTQCPSCGVHLCLDDFDINVPSTQPILTRGDVLIRKNGNVSASQIKCRDLKVFGMVSGQIECTGDLVLRTSGTIIGEIRCRRLVVEKGSDLRLHNKVCADDVASRYTVRPLRPLTSTLSSRHSLQKVK